MPAANDSGDAVKVAYTYDTLNRKRAHIQHKASGNLTTRYTYDTEGNLKEFTDANGQLFTTVYDELNRPSEQLTPANDDIISIVTSYDENNNVDVITETKPGIGSTPITETTDHDYDLLDRLVRRDQRGHVVTYTYDNNGNRTSVTAPGGSTTYTFDTRNRLQTALANGNTTRYSYQQNAWLEQVEQGNGTHANYRYDDAGRVTNIINRTADAAILSQFEYLYDENGNRTQQSETQNGFTQDQVVITAYTYDSLDRLEQFTHNTQSGTVVTSTESHTYTFYPSYDRRTEVVVKDGVTLKDRAYNYDETYWVNSITDSAPGSTGELSYQYDNNGNTLHKTDTTGGAASTLFSYNARNQLKAVKTGALNSEINKGQYDYNYAGMRIRHLDGERGDVEYIYDDKSIIDEVVNQTSQNLAHYRYGDRLLSLDAPQGEQFYHYASLGTTANLSNATGQNQVAYRTDPYGEITQQEGESVNRQVFTGHEHDEETGLIYMKARFYDPDIGRFLNQDTYLGENGTPPSLHRYLYAYSNPNYYIDENGNFSLEGHVNTTRDAYSIAVKKGYLKDTSRNLIRSQFRENLEAGSVIPDVVDRRAAMAFVKLEMNIPGEEMAAKGIGKVSRGIGKLTGKIKRFIAPEASETIERAKHAWDDSDSGPTVMHELETRRPGIKNNETYQKFKDSHYGEGQYKHMMGPNTKDVLQQAISQILDKSQNYWKLTSEGNDLQAAWELGEALHTIQDSYSGSHVARNKDGEIQKAFDYNPQSPHLHGKHDVVFSDHPTRVNARDASVEYIRLLKKYEGKPAELRKALHSGIFATDLDDTVPNPAPKRETTESGIRAVKDYFNNNEHEEHENHDHD